ncbi:TlyA family RNA methyltransferase [Gelria sp. Kuro-4]|uniref:TlyA family RNA methyltransferase n=1 Tax=Gelria sp. Kuro-4 TaxID=2796927 RepID=UPI001BEF180E|nr:TlyA family RNA methyltransferase [Gelria sp. Kuro-4]MDI3522043.1 rRNA (cytidine1920-2-O)/16S rRNA (cytidine1409-2-O)-methyltransferase [Bacillota bacterium]BCV25113.1 TlyA family rRNA (cytidine-2'-O)-methyltransferase [Gelria sp. Kuro-4]
MAGKRLDVLLVERGLAPTRERAQARVLAGEVLVNGRPAEKPGTRVPAGAELTLTGSELPYVSRGGLKLEKAIRSFQLDFAGKVVLDVGASTGGFSDCALQNGAARVYAVDVGYGQLAWKLRQDPRVVVLERTNIRHLAPGTLTPPPEIACIDVSFISLTKVVPVVAGLLTGQKEIVALVKPQFEVGKGRVGKGGIVRSPALHQEVLAEIVAEIGKYVTCAGVDYSPIKGTKGNIEYLLYAREGPTVPLPSLAAVVAAAHAELDAARG